MIYTDYDNLVREHFNLFDTPTRKMLINLEDGEQSQMLGALSSSLYNKIKDGTDKIDFGTIPRSRGDITKVDKFADTEECLVILRKIVTEYAQDPAIVDNVIKSIDNVKAFKPQFMRGFAANVDFVMTLYNLVVLSIEQSVSFLISVCIQFIKDPETKTMQMALDKVAYYNAKDNLVYEQLVQFNNACMDGTIEKVLDTALKNKGMLKENTLYNECDVAMIAQVDSRKPETDLNNDELVPPPVDAVPIARAENPNFIEPQPKDEPRDIDAEMLQEDPVEDHGDEIEANDAVTPVEDVIDDHTCSTNEGIGSVLAAGAGGLVAAGVVFSLLLKVVIPMMRNMVYFLIHSTMKFADCLKMQANLIELNAYNLQSASEEDDGFDAKKRAKIVAKQLKIANGLKVLGNKIATIFNKSNKAARDDVAKAEQEKVTVQDVKNDLPADVYNKSVLF